MIKTVLPEQLITYSSPFERELGKILLNDLKLDNLTIFYQVSKKGNIVIQLLHNQIYIRMVWSDKDLTLSPYIMGNYIAEDPFTGTSSLGDSKEIELDNLHNEILSILHRVKEISDKEIEMEKIKIELKPL